MTSRVSLLLQSHRDHQAQGAGSVRRSPQVSPCPRLEKTRVALRKVPGALALGLLASLVAHGALYGGEHSMGGGYHGVLLQLAAAAGLSLAIFFGFLGWNNARVAANGSVLAARLAERLPGFGSLLTAATLWYTAAEYAEPHHASAFWLAVPLVIAAVSWSIQRCCRYALALLADAIIAVLRRDFAPRTPVWVKQPTVAPLARRIAYSRRCFARPPPILV